MAMELYELCGADPEIRFSPYVWRSKLALAHKGLDYKPIPWRFTEKEAISFSGQHLVPVLKDNETTVTDSWTIANYLDEAYPDRPSLFGGPAGKAGIQFFRYFADSILGFIAPLAVLPVWDILGEEDQVYFRETREARFGKKLEDICGDREERLKDLAKSLSTFRRMLSDQPFAGGDAPLYSDHLLFGTLQWGRVVCPFPLLAQDDPVAAWMERMLDAYGAHARAGKTVTS